MTAAAPVFTVGGMLRADLERLDDEIAEIKGTLSTLRPGVNGKIAEYETELQDQLAELEAERDGILAELNGEDEDDE
jgi:hypothetical protein